MTDLYLYPNSYEASQGTIGTTGCACVGVSEECVDDVWDSPDDDTTRVQLQDAGALEWVRWGLDDMPPAGVISNVTNRARLMVQAGGINVRVRTILGGSAYLTCNTTAQSYTTVTSASATNPDTAAAWLEADLDAAELQGYRAAHANWSRITMCQLKVEYDPPGGGLITWGWKWIPPLLASGLFSHSLRSMPRYDLLDAFYRTIRSRTGEKRVFPSPDEVYQVADAMLVRPKFIFLSQPKLRGVGDLIAKVTSAVGIKPCEGCERRQWWLNEKFAAFSY